MFSILVRTNTFLFNNECIDKVLHRMPKQLQYSQISYNRSITLHDDLKCQVYLTMKRRLPL